MQEYHVLVVDDQRDVRHMLRAGLETLGPDVRVIDVPSGEEAILVASRQQIDLLVIDVHLPGMTGLELRERVLKSSPEMRTILITGRTEPKIRREVANAGADAFFFKPIEIADFLEAAHHCLGLADFEPAAVETTLPDQAMLDKEEGPTLSQRLADLRTQLKAIAVLLLDDLGQVVAQAGEAPFDLNESSLLTSLKSSLDAASKVAYDMGSRPPSNMSYYAGASFDLCLRHVSQEMGLLAVLPAANWEARIWKNLQIIQTATGGLVAALVDMGVPAAPVLEESQTAAPEEIEDEPIPEELMEELDAVFDQAKDAIKANEADAFWDALADERTDDISRSDAISYDQAAQLGLTPDD